MDATRLKPEEVIFLIDDIGREYVDMRNQCFTECSNLFDTHEVTLPEQKCAKNCFKKFIYAYKNFQEISVKKLDKVKDLH